MENIAIYGAGGYGREVACLIKAINREFPVWNLIGFFDDTMSIGEQNSYGPILGGLEELNNWDEKLSIAMAIGNPYALADLTTKIVNSLLSFPNLIAPDVAFHDKNTVEMGIGNIVFFHSLISCSTKFGNFNLLNNDVFVGHDSIIGSCNVINPSARISGNVEIGDNNFFGVCSIILQKVKIGINTKISAGSCVFRNTKDNNLYTGNPAVIRLTPGSVKK